MDSLEKKLDRFLKSKGVETTSEDAESFKDKINRLSSKVIMNKETIEFYWQKKSSGEEAKKPGNDLASLVSKSMSRFSFLPENLSSRVKGQVSGQLAGMEQVDQAKVDSIAETRVKQQYSTLKPESRGYVFREEMVRKNAGKFGKLKLQEIKKEVEKLEPDFAFSSDFVLYSMENYLTLGKRLGKIQRKRLTEEIMPLIEKYSVLDSSMKQEAVNAAVEQSEKGRIVLENIDDAVRKTYKAVPAENRDWLFMSEITASLKFKNENLGEQKIQAEAERILARKPEYRLEDGPANQLVLYSKNMLDEIESSHISGRFSRMAQSVLSRAGFIPDDTAKKVIDIAKQHDNRGEELTRDALAGYINEFYMQIPMEEREYLTSREIKDKAWQEAGDLDEKIVMEEISRTSASEILLSRLSFYDKRTADSLYSRIQMHRSTGAESEIYKYLERFQFISLDAKRKICDRVKSELGEGSKPNPRLIAHHAEVVYRSIPPAERSMLFFEEVVEIAKDKRPYLKRAHIQDLVKKKIEPDNRLPPNFSLYVETNHQPIADRLEDVLPPPTVEEAKAEIPNDKASLFGVTNYVYHNMFRQGRSITLNELQYLCPDHVPASRVKKAYNAMMIADWLQTEKGYDMITADDLRENFGVNIPRKYATNGHRKMEPLKMVCSLPDSGITHLIKVYEKSMAGDSDIF